MAFASAGFQIISLPRPSASVLEEFDALPVDPYCGGNHRFRRFSQYKLEWMGHSWLLTLLPHRPFIQSKQYNSFAGGIPRHLEPLRIDPFPQIQAAAEIIDLDRTRAWQLNVHQCRVVATADTPGISVPEGPHRDGHEIGMVAVFRRHNIAGGETHLLANGGTGEPFFTHVLRENEAVVYRDEEMFHFATDVRALDDTGGYRDLWIVAVNSWENRRYGDDFEAGALAKASQ
ncbi:MAG TPA: 2OG-Fe dioxygenase family protein [Acidimicrobiales bacterium]|nr:2OG-Fe dioxygenase family protein [Acidimicrobiales bacterium]